MEVSDVEFEEESTESDPVSTSALVAPPPSKRALAPHVRKSPSEIMLDALRRLDKRERAYFRGTVVAVSEETMPLPDSMLFGYERELENKFPVRIAEVSVEEDYCNVAEDTMEVVFRPGGSSFPRLVEGKRYAILGAKQGTDEGTQVFVSSFPRVKRLVSAEDLPPLLASVADTECEL